MFSLRALFVAIAYVAMACSALKFRTPLWGSVICTMTIAIGIGAAIVAWQSPASRRVYGPLALVIGIYLLIVFCPLFQDMERQLITSHLIFQWWPQLSEPMGYSAEYWEEFFYMVPRNKYENRASWGGLVGLIGFYNSVHSVAAVVFGTVAGLLTAWACHDRRNA